VEQENNQEYNLILSTLQSINKKLDVLDVDLKGLAAKVSHFEGIMYNDTRTSARGLVDTVDDLKGRVTRLEEKELKKEAKLSVILWFASGAVVVISAIVQLIVKYLLK